MISSSTQELTVLNYSLLLLAHIVCADQQIHSNELKLLHDLMSQKEISEITFQNIDKIFSQDISSISLREAALNVPLADRNEILTQALEIAHIDNFFSPLEREAIDKIVKLWGFSEIKYQFLIKKIQSRLGSSQIYDEDSEKILSIGARVLKSVELIFPKSLIGRIAEIAPDNIGQKIERLQREILLSGPEYDEALQQCSKIAIEDYTYAEKALRETYTSLQYLSNNIQQVISEVQNKSNGEGQQDSAKLVAQQLSLTQKNLNSDILRELVNIRESLRAKRRALNHFSIAFMGRTKAGKSTLHAVVTGEGWEAIGVGKQRTTRYNRVYEWKNIRIIDTPGIGAPGGKTDEEVAQSVIEEADIICYVVTNDSIQETEFKFLEILKEKTKPLTILLNLQHNLRDQRRLEYFLSNPERLFKQDGSSGISGHIKRIERYAKEHYSNDYLDIIPVMLLAAQLAQEPNHQELSKQLFEASKIQDFLDSIRISLIEHGAIRRSQTLLGSTVGSIDKPRKWITEQSRIYQNFSDKLYHKHQELKKKIEKAEKDIDNSLSQEVQEIFQDVSKSVPKFADKYWEKNEKIMETAWKNELKLLKFEEKLKQALERAILNFQDEVREAVEEIGNELKLISQLKNQGFKFSFSEQDNFDIKNLIEIGGGILSAVCAIGAFFFPPLAIAGFIFGLGALFGNLFTSREEKRSIAVKNILQALQKQLDDQHQILLREMQENFRISCSSLEDSIDQYFVNLINGIAGIARQLRITDDQLQKSEYYLNEAYAKRIIDWVNDQYEPLTDMSIRKNIVRVNRVFGQKLEIFTLSKISTKKSIDKIQQVLQENIVIQTTKK